MKSYGFENQFSSQLLHETVKHPNITKGYFLIIQDIIINMILLNVYGIYMIKEKM